MNHFYLRTPNSPIIKSWFGFSLGLILVAFSLLDLLKTPTLSEVLTVLGFLCALYPLSQTTGWNKPMKEYFKNSNTMSTTCSYLFLLSTCLVISSSFF
jgi:hypothetical protein